MRIRRRTAFARAFRERFTERFSRHRGVELSAENELFAERLSEVLRGYVAAEDPRPSALSLPPPEQREQRRPAGAEQVRR
jgi:hypothetical protein